MSRKGKIGLVLFTIAVFLPLCLIFVDWIPDDAYISFCYAKNFATGKGFVFYPGEKVEGFSNLLWTLLMSGVYTLGADIVRTAVVLSLIFGIASLLLIQSLLRSAKHTLVNEDPESSNVQTCFFITPVLCFPLLFYATSGLETTASLFFLALGALLHIRAAQKNLPMLHVASSYSFLIVSLLRPEGIIFLLVNGVFVAAQRRILPGKIFFLSMLPFALFLFFIAAKSAYFGSLIPNTYFAKPGASLHYLAPIPRGAGYLVHFFLKSGCVLLLPFALYPPRDASTMYIWRYMWSIVLVQLFFIIFVGGDILRFDRFTLPFSPFLLALSLIGFGTAVRSTNKSLRVFLTRTVITCLILIWIMNVVQIPVVSKKYCYHDWMHANVHKKIGNLLGEILPEKSTVVTNEVGAIAYHSGLPVIDMIGLTDRTIAHFIYESYMRYGIGGSDWSVTEISRYLLSRKPDCIILPAYQPLSLEDLGANGDRMHSLWYAILANEEFSRAYRSAFMIKVHTLKYLYVFVNRNLVFQKSPPRPGGYAKCMDIQYE
jgi:arabinofuranosyltransferase